MGVGFASLGILYFIYIGYHLFEDYEYRLKRENLTMTNSIQKDIDKLNRDINKLRRHLYYRKKK